MLAPQRTDDAQFGERRGAAEQAEQLLVLERRDPVLGDERWRDDRIARAGRGRRN